MQMQLKVPKEAQVMGGCQMRQVLSPHRKRAEKGVAELAVKKINYPCFTFLN